MPTQVSDFLLVVLRVFRIKGDPNQNDPYIRLALLFAAAALLVSDINFFVLLGLLIMLAFMIAEVVQIIHKDVGPIL